MLNCPVCTSANPDDSASCAQCHSALEMVANAAPQMEQELQAMAAGAGSGSESGGIRRPGRGVDLAPGYRLGERYQIVSRLGEGGMGTVYKALDRELDREIAVKTIRPDIASSLIALRRLKQETLLAGRIANQNVVRVFDIGVAGEVRFITMELVDGESLKVLLVRLKKLPAERATAIMTQVCEGLAAAHEQGVIHRDLKPQNVLIGRDGRARICDFGLARPLEQTGITRTGVVIGTPDYMSPEQALTRPVDARSDIFSFGVIFYELLTGSLPHSGKGMMGSFLARTREPARPIESLEPELDPALASLVMRCLERDPTQRFQSAEEILEALGQPCREHPVRRVLKASNLSPGVMLGTRYRIEAEAGQGATGKVYRATDLDLDRTVALKVVRPNLGSGAESLDRLKHEISLASRISHKNVLRIHDLGEVDGLRFVSMAWADGEDLGQLMKRTGIFPEKRILEFASEICEGLEAAGEQGIVHRDLKPANILLNSAGHACIADFGLAGTTGVEESPDSSEAEEVSGTPRYMSPEQAEGKPTDQRTDIYSLGLILYEMATGNIPFQADSVLQTMAQRITEAPKDPRLLNPAISRRLANLILRCLEREPARRFETAHALMNELRHVAGAPALGPSRGRRNRWYAGAAGLVGVAGAALGLVAHYAPKEVPPSGRYVAVLPFRAIGVDPNLKFEGQGVAEAISARLFSLSSVHPISPLALEQVDLAQPIKAIARRVGANLVVDGSLQGAGDSITIIVSLDNVQTGKRVWSESFPGSRANLLGLEEEICNGVIAALKVKPTSAERERVTPQPTQNLNAYDEYLKGRDTLKNRRDATGANLALALFEKASAKDPSFALAWTGLADASLEMYRLKHESFWSEKATAAAKEAQSRNDNLPEVHFALGSIYTATGKNGQAVGEIKRALQLEPNSDDGYVRLGRAYLATGDGEAALAALKKAAELNPYYWYNHERLGRADLAMGLNDDALKEFQREAELDPTNATAHNLMGIIYSRQSFWDRCIPEFKKAIQLSPSSDAYTNLGTAYFYAGQYPDSVRMFEKAVELDPKNVVSVGNLADAYRHANQWEKAQATYDRAIELAYEQLEVNPQDAGMLGNLALFYARKGGVVKGREIIARARSINGTNNQLMYDEAVIYALSRRPQEAIAALKRALENGYSLEEARREQDLAMVRTLPGFGELSRISNARQVAR